MHHSILSACVYLILLVDVIVFIITLEQYVLVHQCGGFYRGHSTLSTISVATISLITLVLRERARAHTLVAVLNLCLRIRKSPGVA